MNGIAALLEALRVRRRVALLLRGVAFGGLGTAVVLIAIALAGASRIALPTPLLLWLSCSGLALAWLWRGHDDSPRAAADVVERHTPAAANLVRTAAEVLEGGPAAASPLADRVLRDAALRTQDLRAATLLPLWRPLWLAAGGVVLVAAMAWRPLPVTAGRVAAAIGLPVDPVIEDIAVTITAPAYTGRPRERVTDVQDLRPIVGSRVAVDLRLRAARLVVARAGDSDTLAVPPDRRLALDWPADADALVGLTPLGEDGRAGTTRVIALRPVPDAAPRVRIDVPARDLRLGDSAPAPLRVTLSADDDLGLTALTLRVTRIRGAGEQYAFLDGDAALRITREGATRWQAEGTLRLDTLQLEAGDIVVYRALVRDGRPGAAAVESESYLVTVAAPGAEAMEGFAADDEQDRYGRSQAMVIQRTERLVAELPALDSTTRWQRQRQLAAEQRSVRAEFVFMMGGELADDANDHLGHMHLNEEAEAEAEDDILAGRLANRGRIEMTRAIRAMSLAAQALDGGDLATALAEERRALAALELALSRARYILRALTTRERIDPARRLTGRPDGSGSQRLPRDAAAPDALAALLRDGLTTLGTMDLDAGVSADGRDRLTRLATRLVTAAPGDTLLLGVAEDLLRTAADGADATRWRAAVERAALALQRRLRPLLPQATGVQPPAAWRAQRGGVDR